MGHDLHHDDAPDHHAPADHDDHGTHHPHETASVNRGLLLAVFAIFIFGGVLALGQGSAQTPEPTDLLPHHKGAADATVVIVEASDFQCPYCARVQPSVHRILEEYPEHVRLEYRHNPLSFHDQAIPAAVAAVAAARQNRFWEMHTALYKRVSRLNNTTIEEAAQEAGLDMEKFAKDRNDPSASELVQQDQSVVMTLGARGTPTFFINGLVVKGAQPYPVFRELVRAQIAKATRLKNQGLTAREAQLALVREQSGDAEQYIQLLGAQPLAGLGNTAKIQWERVQESQ